MSKHSDVAPALTPEEWKRAHGTLVVDCVGELYWGESFLFRGDDPKAIPLEPSVDEPPRLKALAALCLNGQPFGFTREDVELLRYLNEGHDLKPDEDSGFIDRWLTREQADRIASLLERVAALLPPEEPR